MKGLDACIGKQMNGLHAILKDNVFSSKPAVMDPLVISITQSSIKNGDLSVEEDDPAYYKLVFRTYTDIWFENTEIEAINRNRLRRVFQEVYRSFNVVDTKFTSDWYSKDQLKNIVFGQD